MTIVFFNFQLNLQFTHLEAADTRTNHQQPPFMNREMRTDTDMLPMINFYVPGSLNGQGG